MRIEESVYNIRAILDKLNNEGIEPVYNTIKTWTVSSGSSPYAGLVNDLVCCCPNAQDWKNPRNREHFENDIKYYCDYWLDICNNDN